MPDQTKVSIIIPVFNRRELLVRTLQSVSSQSWRPIEIIVVDNGSTDGTYEAAVETANTLNDKDCRVKVLRHPERGAAGVRNVGFQHATGEIILFFDSDDIMIEDAVESYMEAFRRNPKADLVIAYFDWLLPGNKRKKRKLRSGDLLLNHFHHCILSTQSFAATRKFLTKVADLHGELWPEHLGVWDDWALGFRLLSFNPTTIRLDKCVALVEPQAQSITGEAYCTTCAERYLAAIADIETTASLHRKKSPVISSKQYRKWKNLTLYRRVMLAALLSRESRKVSDEILKSTPYADRRELHNESRRLLSDALQEAPSAAVRRTLRFAYAYINAGLRGCASLVTPFL